MALQTKVINGKSVEFDPVVRDEIINMIKPDGGAADAKYCISVIFFIEVVL